MGAVASAVITGVEPGLSPERQIVLIAG